MFNNIYTPVMIRDDELVTLTQMDEITRLTYLRYRNTEARIRKVDKNHYINLGDESGVVLDYKHTDNRQQSLKSVNKTFKNLRDIITANTADAERCKWITLTYEENMTDLDTLKKDWGNFLKKAHRKWKDFEYIMVKEPQERGAWHLHVIMIFDGKAPYIDSGVLRKKWGKGYVAVKKVEDGFNLGKYLVKKDRLSLYPKGVRIFNCSKGIKRPVKSTVTKAEADLAVRDKEEISRYNTVLHDDDGREINEVSVTTYRSKKKGGDKL